VTRQLSSGTLKLLATRSYPRDSTLAILEYLEQQLRLDPLDDFPHIPLVAAVELVANNLGLPQVRPASLRAMIDRTAEHHCLTVRHNNIQLRGDVLVEFLNQPKTTDFYLKQWIKRRRARGLTAETQPKLYPSEAHLRDTTDYDCNCAEVVTDDQDCCQD